MIALVRLCSLWSACISLDSVDEMITSSDFIGDNGLSNLISSNLNVRSVPGFMRRDTASCNVGICSSDCLSLFFIHSYSNKNTIKIEMRDD